MRFVRLLSWMLTALLAGGIACGPPQSADRASLLERDGGAVTPPSRPGATSTPGGPAVARGGGSNGVRCQVNAGCKSGACVDGVCCEGPCAGACLACNLPGSEGRCLPVPDGQDPGDECTPEAASTCGRDGSCDGRGACRLHADGTECAVRSCQNATERAPGRCDGQGACKAGPSRSCAPAVCIEDACGMGCTGDPDCKEAGTFCDAGTCRPQRVLAAACDRDAQCTTGHCADGVCCSTACSGTCQACNNAGSAGSCEPVPDGRDPRRECLVEPVHTCGKAGGCNGKGACRLHEAGSPCGFGSCEGSTVYGPSTCDGLGACKKGPASDCDPYVCNGMGCWTACATSDQCKSGRTCQINSCR
jgi:hypothetical protein